MPLEDDLSDILKKARHGQGLSVMDVTRITGLPHDDVTAIERGNPPRNRADLRALAQALNLRAPALEQIAFDHWEPVAQQPPAWVDIIHGSINGYGVQGYIVHDERDAVVIDTGYNAPAIVQTLSRRGLSLIGICLTHGHTDHADGIDRLLRHREVPVYLGAGDAELLSWHPPAGVLAIPGDGQEIMVGHRSVRCMPTPGHTPGGVCYRVDDPEHPMCFVGDTLFAGSIGRSNPTGLYQTHLDAVRSRVLTLPPGYRLMPGHGPATTVEEERDHNPFYA
ncbi:MAG: MBL fold metallo-hydrolase [Nitrospiraceae bacterium]|nr:MBL fold metallo-hydrolase [Nitrospiraceae bacterium]